MTATPSLNPPPAQDTAPIRVRIAPSPTGDPHVGTAYIGLLNYIYARQRSGQFILRIEDTDRTRFVPTSEQMIFNSLRWVGLTWDEGPDVGGPYGPYRQSERTAIYREHAEILLANGHAYRSFETADELEAMRQQQIAAKVPPRYNGAHRHLTQAQIDAYLAEGRPYTVRLKVPENQSTTFLDELRGPITFDHNNVDDQVLLKSDGFPTYHLANVVDDHLMRITDVIRAEEWISSTPKHVLLYAAFGWELPRFWHMPLLRNVDKSKISKRKNPVSLVFYQQSGYLPQAMLNFLGLLGGGMAQPTEQEIVSKGLNTKEGDIFSLGEMLEKFDFRRISLGGPVFDLVKLKWLNGEYLRKLTPEEFFSALRSSVLSDSYLRSIAPLVQSRIEILGQFGDMTGFFFADNVLPPESVWLPKKRTFEESLAFASEQLTTLEAAAWEPETIESSLKSLGEAKQWSVKENFMLLRAILTGSTSSPPLLESLIVFGKARTLDRLRRFLEIQKKQANQRK
ncbi:MAG: glutamate--tRNA ligase [Acidobacteriaceae bacterium]